MILKETMLLLSHFEWVGYFNVNSVSTLHNIRNVDSDVLNSNFCQLEHHLQGSSFLVGDQEDNEDL